MDDDERNGGDSEVETGGPPGSPVGGGQSAGVDINPGEPLGGDVY